MVKLTQEPGKWIRIDGLPRTMNAVARNAGGRWVRGSPLWEIPPIACCWRSLIQLLKSLDIAFTDDTSFANSLVDLKPEIIGSNFIFEPYDVQRKGLAYICENDAFYIAWRMGVGKTKPIVDYIANSATAKMVIVLCPKSVVSVWRNEIRKHWPFDELPVIASPTKGLVKARLKRVQHSYSLSVGMSQKFILVVNYEAARSAAFKEWILSKHWNLFVPDEAHKLKQHNGATSKFATQLRDVSDKRVALSGTPIPNTYADIFAQYRVLDPSIFGQTITEFRKRYCEMGGYKNKQIIGYRNEDELRSKIDSIMDVVRLEDVVDMPPYSDQIIKVQLCKEARSIYNQLRDEMIADVSAICSGEVVTDAVDLDPKVLVATNVLTKMLRLQQITSGQIPVDDDFGERKFFVVDTSKREAVTEMIDAIHPDDPVVVFGRFTHDIQCVHEIGDDLKRHVDELSGRRDDVHGLWKPKSGAICAVQIQSGNAGVDLTASRYGIFNSTGFDLAVYDQCRSRLYRKGQEHPVIFKHICATNTIDRAVYRALSKKSEKIAQLLSAGLVVNYSELQASVAKELYLSLTED